MAQRRAFYLMLLIVGLSFALRLYRLDTRPFWFDEGITVDLAMAPPSYVLHTIDRPPLYYLLLHEWVNLAGVSPFALRFFSAWWGTLALVFFYLLARQLIDRRLSLWALALATFSPFYIYYAQEARTYSMTFNFALMSCWALLVWLKNGRTRCLILNALATLACLYTHYSLLLLPFAQTVLVLLTLWRDSQRSQPAFTTPITLGLNFYVPLPHHLPKFRFSRKVKPIWQWLIVQASVIVLFLPWPIHARYGLRELFAPQANPSPFTVLQQVANFARMTLLEFSAGQPLGWPIGEAIALAFVGLIVLGLLSPTLPKLSRHFLAIVLLLPPLIMLLLPRTAVYYAPKYLIMITPAFYILAVVGVEALWQARLHFFTRRVAVAMGVMFLVGVPMLSIGWAAMQPFQADRTVQLFWAEDLQKPSPMNYSRAVAFVDEGITLSRIQVLPVKGNSIWGIDASGQIYLNYSGAANFRYDPKSGSVQTIGGPYLEDLRFPGGYALASDGRLYNFMEKWHNLHGEWTQDDTRLTQFDPDTGLTRDLGSVISTTRDLLVGPGDQIYGLPPGSWPTFKYDVQRGILAPLVFSSTTSLPKKPYIQNVLIGQDNWLYGTLSYSSQIFALNLTSGKLITHTLTTGAKSLTPRPGGGVYVNGGQSFWTFDTSGTLTPLPVASTEKEFSTDLLVVRHNGHLVGKSTLYPPYFFDYDPTTGAFQRMHSNTATWGPIVATTDKLYAIFDNHLALIDSEQYTTPGYVQSRIILPVTLMLTDTVIGGSYASVTALTCGQNGKVYGMKVDSATSKWMFEYDPQQPAAAPRQIAPTTSTKDKDRFLAGTALVPLRDGRLVGGTSNGYLFVYTPATDETQTIGQVAEGLQLISALAVDRTGIVYGGTRSLGRHALFFSFDPVTSVTKSIDLPIVDPRLIGAITVGPDERVYIGADRNLVIYDSQTQQATIAKVFEYQQSSFEHEACTIRALVLGPDKQIYGGCGSHLFAYDPARNTLHELGTTPEGGPIASLTVGSDAQIYGSVQHEYMNRYSTYRANEIFVYNPTEQRMTNLGMAVKTGPVILTACGDGTIYGASNTTNSNYRGPAYLFAFRTDCPQGAIGSWDKVTWQAQTPPGTRITVDVLDNQSSTTLVRNIENGGSLQAIDAQKYPLLSLRANLFTSDPNVTPVLQSWRVDYTFACASQPNAGQP
ncbi:hypothetical protein TFLX_03364 [Thermoflexales bacterium]|nr:hypothetical protein TFLX_03364 [Thermoflexales bacterium]